MLYPLQQRLLMKNVPNCALFLAIFITRRVLLGYFHMFIFIFYSQKTFQLRLFSRNIKNKFTLQWRWRNFKISTNTSYKKNANYHEITSHMRRSTVQIYGRRSLMALFVEWMISIKLWDTGKTWKSASFWRRCNRRVNEWNEFVEWHVAWLAEWHNYAECNIYRMTQRNKFNSKAALFLEPIWRSSQCVIRLVSIGLSTGSTDDHKYTVETSSSSVYGGGYITVGFTKLNRNRKQASRHFSIVSHLKKQRLTMTLF